MTFRLAGVQCPASNNMASPALFAIDPPECQVPAVGGTSSHQVVNSSDKRVVFKVKSSNNNEYRLRPVFAFVDAAGSTPLEVVRLVSGGIWRIIYKSQTIDKFESNLLYKFSPKQF